MTSGLERRPPPRAGGATAGESALKMAYEQAQKAYVKNGINRILLATDGDFNVGISDPEALKTYVAEQKKSGISLTTLGYGSGNYNERLMEQLADAGDGNYSYIDSPEEAQKVLHRQLSSTLATVAQDVKIQVEFNPAKRNCIVTKGKLNDPYTNTTINFKRGRKSSDLIPIDHVVALGDAWYSGAYQWDADRRRNFANDPINLQATNRESNTQKSAKNAAEWLPPNTAYQCEYVGRQITIKSTYGLSVTPAEKTAMEKVLATCS